MQSPPTNPTHPSANPPAHNPTHSASPDLFAWAEQKQLHNPGQDGSFALGAISMGAGAVSGGPVFLPRRDDTPLPPDERLGLKGEAFHIGSDGEKARKEREGREKGKRDGGVFGHRGMEGGGEKEKKEKRGSWGGLFHRRGKEGEGEGGEVVEGGEDGDTS